MKKTMFITSVIMVVVMAIALTTSSLAWFTAAGSATVTTSALTLEAKATAATGLLISSASEAGAWYGNIDLVSGNSQANMIPAVPYQATAGDDIIDALVGNAFISNTVDMNGKWSTAAAKDGNTASEVLYFQKEFWITTVDTANDLYVGVDDENPITWKKGNDAYTGAVVNSSDPVIYVAVLASKDCDLAANRDPSGVTTTESRRADSDNWEILQIFASTGASTVAFGGQASAFTNNGVAEESLLNYAAATDALTISSKTTSSNKTSDSLDKVTTHYTSGAAQATGEVKRFKVVAWYDGNSLLNSNSNFSLNFSLKFKAYTTGNSGS